MTATAANTVIFPAYVAVTATSMPLSSLVGNQDPARPMKVTVPAQATPPAQVQLSGAGAEPSVSEKALGDVDQPADTSTTCGSPSDDGSDSASEMSFGNVTTVAILNIPYTYPKWKLQAEMDAGGFTYDYFHFPKDSRKGRNRGFSFVNFTSVEVAEAFRKAFHNRLLSYPGDKEKNITVMASSLQGFDGNAKLHPFAAARPSTGTRRARPVVAARPSAGQGKAQPRSTKPQQFQLSGGSTNLHRFAANTFEVIMRFAV